MADNVCHVARGMDARSAAIFVATAMALFGFPSPLLHLVERHFVFRYCFWHPRVFICSCNEVLPPVETEVTPVLWWVILHDWGSQVLVKPPPTALVVLRLQRRADYCRVYQLSACQVVLLDQFCLLGYREKKAFQSLFKVDML